MRNLINFHIAIMNANRPFPRHAAKQKRLVRMISGVSVLTSDISKYPCLSQASTSDHYSTTCLQYSIIQEAQQSPAPSTSGKLNSFYSHLKSCKSNIMDIVYNIVLIGELNIVINTDVLIFMDR